MKADDCEMVCWTLWPAKAKLSPSPTSALNKDKGFPGWRMATAATDSPVKRASFLHVMQILPVGVDAAPKPSAGTGGGKVTLRLSAGSKEYEVSFNAEGECGGTIKTGSAAAMPLAGTIVAKGILVNRPADRAARATFKSGA